MPRPFYREVTTLTSEPVSPKPEAFHLADQAVADFDRMLKPSEMRELFVAGIPHATVHGRNGFVIDERGGVLKDAPKVLRPGFTAPDSHPLRGQKLTGRKEKLSGLAATIAVFSVGNYYHWLYDALPRLRVLREAGVDLSSVEHFVVTADDYGFVKATMTALGLPQDRLRVTGDGLNYECEYLLVPSMPGYADRSAPAWMVDDLRSSFLPKTDTREAPRKIFIARKPGRRSLENEAQIHTILKEAGYVAVYPEDHSFSEQVAFFQGAESVVGLHGAGLTNILFCQPGTRVLEVFAPDYVHPCYWPIAARLGLPYAYLIGSNVRTERSYNVSEVGASILLEPDRLKTMLTEFLS